MTKFEQLRDTLRKELLEEQYATGSRFPSVYELAERFDINKTTANKVLVALMTEGFLGRGENSRAGMKVRTPHPYPCGKIAFFGSIQSSFAALLAEGIFSAAYQNDLIAALLNPHPEDMHGILLKLEQSGFMGILMTGGYLLSTTLPVIYMDVNLPDFSGFQVSCDTFESGRAIVRELLNAGHREIVFYTSREMARSPTLGVRKAMLEAGYKTIENRFYRSMD